MQNNTLPGECYLVGNVGGDCCDNHNKGKNFTPRMMLCQAM